MKNTSLSTVLACASISLGLALNASAQITGNMGTSSVSYGSALSVQTFGTDYGSQAAATGGNQLDAAYGVISGGNLNLFFAGNTSDGNSLYVFLADGQTGQSTLNVSGGSYSPTASTTLDGSQFSPGFSATQMIDVNTYAGTIYGNLFDLVNGVGGYSGSVADAGGIITGVDYAIAVAVNESSAAGSGANTAPGALAVTTGWELSIPILSLNNASSVEVLAAIGNDGGGSGSLANQFLAPANVGGYPQTFNFSSTPGEFFTVAAVPEPSTWVLSGISGLSMLLMFRRRK